MKNFICYFLITFPFGFISCNRPECENANAIFAEFSPETPEYKKELAIQLNSAGQKKLTYWFEEYVEIEGKEHFKVYIQGKQLCASGFLAVEDWTKLRGIKRTKGVGYRGAELKGLEIEVKQDSTSTFFVLKDIEAIID